MFDAGVNCGSGVSASEPSEDRSARRQYTLKGVEVEAIRLMREAAHKEGMKIGSWVSLRMREAAERALSRDSSIARHQPSLPAPHSDGGFGPYEEAGLTELLQDVVRALDQCRESSEQRFLHLERELHELTASQRTILTVLVNQRAEPTPQGSAN